MYVIDQAAADALTAELHRSLAQIQALSQPAARSAKVELAKERVLKLLPSLTEARLRLEALAQEQAAADTKAAAIRSLRQTITAIGDQLERQQKPGFARQWEQHQAAELERSVLKLDIVATMMELANLKMYRTGKRHSPAGAAGALILKGYASTSARNRFGEVVSPESLRKAAAGYMARGGQVFLKHDTSRVIGRCVKAEPDLYGLWVEVEVPRSGPAAWHQKAVQDIRKKDLWAFSISGPMGPPDANQHIDVLAINEISVTDTPANTAARFSISER